MKRNILKYTAIILSLIIIIAAFAGCSAGSASDDSGSATNNSEKSAQVEVNAANADYFTERDLDFSYADRETQTIVLNGSSAESTSSAVKTDGSVITITDEGVYIVSGKLTDGGIIVDAEETDKIQIVLNGAEISNSDGAAIYAESADKLFITLAEGTENSLSDGGKEYTQTDSEKTVDGVIFADCDLTLNGAGKLTVNAGWKHAVVSKNDLVITGGEYDITSAEKGFEGENSIRICGGGFTVKSGDDAFHADEETDKEKGFVYIQGGDFKIESGDDGIHGVTTLTIDGGSFDITAHEALEATVITINGGEINISASDDGINAAAKSEFYDPQVIINAGSLTIKMGAGDTDAIDSNGTIEINGGTVDITAQSAFDYETSGKINGGEVTVNGEKVTEITNQFGGGMGGMRGGLGGFGNREQMTDENGETLTRPERENFTDENGETVTGRGRKNFGGNGGTPPEMPTDENGNAVFPGNMKPDGEMPGNVTGDPSQTA